jgi:hypothetical protein
MKAFPRPNTIHPDDLGMDLRDYFAANAMQAIITRCDEKSSEIEHIDTWIGSYAYTVADEMMKARR